MRINKKGLSPLIATLLLVVFALAIGTATMNWGKTYVEDINQAPKKDIVENINQPSIIIPYDQIIDDNLKLLQIRYITNKITKDEYLTKEKEILND